MQKRTDFFDNSLSSIVPDEPLATRNKPHNNQLCADLSRLNSAYPVVSHFLRFAWQTTARVLKQLSAFELKAWLGITLFASYFTDIFFGSELSVFKLICIFATAAGLVFIAKSSKYGSVNYKQIILPLVLYLVSKYGYGLIIRSFSPYASSTMQLLPAMVIISLIMLPRVHIRELIKNNRSGVVKVVLARIPNTLGMLLENAVISISLTNYSFIQPMILVTLFVIGLIRREKRSRLNLIGSMICIVGIVAFQLA